MTDDARLLPRYRTTTQPRRLDDHLHQLEARDNATTATVTAGPRESEDDRRHKRLRGIPVVGAVTGTSPGTDPLAELLRNDHRRRYP